MSKFNFPDEFLNAFSTRMQLPDWYYKFSVDTLNRLKALGVIVGGFEIKRAGDFNENDILSSGQFGEPATLDWDTIYEHFKKEIPIDEPDVVEWMIDATAASAVLLARCNEYERAGSMLLSCCDDPYIPGVRVEDIYFARDQGSVVASRGQAVVVTPQGNFNCPVPGKTSITTKNILAWACVLKAWIKQWVGALLKWKDLAVNPASRIGFANVGGMVAPQFFGHQASRRAFRNIVEMSIMSDKPQTVKLTYRAPTDYSAVLGSASVKLNEGQNVLRFKVRSIFGVPPMVVELQPENGTKCVLDYYKVYP